MALIRRIEASPSGRAGLLAHKGLLYHWKFRELTPALPSSINRKMSVSKIYWKDPMRTLKFVVAILCVSLLLAPGAVAQQTTSANGGFFSSLTRPYMPQEVAPVNFSNTNRLDSLLRAGNLYLSLEDAIALALENNLDIELQRYGPQIAQADLLRANAGGLLRGVPAAVQTGPASAQAQVLGTGGTGGGGGGGTTTTGGATGGAGGTIITATGAALPNLDPVMFTSYGWGHRTRPQSNTVTTGLTAIAFNTGSFSYGVQKGFLSGTTLSFGWNSDSSRSNNPLSDINPFTQSNFQLQISQRLLQGFGIAVNNRNIRVAKNNLRVSDLVFKQQVIATVSSVINLYWDLVSFRENVKVQHQALALAEKLYNDNKKQVEIGTLAPIEIVSAEAQVALAQQNLTIAETQQLQQETIIKNALSRTGVASPSIADAHIVPTTPIRVPDVDQIQPLQDLVETAMQYRPELEQGRINLENTHIGLKGDRSQLLPSLDLQLSLQNNGLAGQTNTLPLRGSPLVRNVDPFFLGGYGTVLEQLFRRNFPDYAIGFSLNIPLRNRSAQADMIRDELSLRQQQIRQQQLTNQIRVDVQNALIAVQQARAQYQAASKQRVLQEQTLEAEQKKYALGASTVFFVIQYQRDLAQAQSAEVSALAAYTKARVGLERSTGQTLPANNIVIDEALRGQVSRPPSPLPPPGPQTP
jgi:outer membrane protein